jgi:hypothetical protein
MDRSAALHCSIGIDHVFSHSWQAADACLVRVFLLN